MTGETDGSSSLLSGVMYEWYDARDGFCDNEAIEAWSAELPRVNVENEICVDEFVFGRFDANADNGWNASRFVRLAMFIAILDSGC